MIQAQTNGRVPPASDLAPESRFPWSRAIHKRFAIDRLQWILLTEIIFPEAGSARAIELALAYCKARGLDVFKRPVHIVQVHDPVAKRVIDTVWPGISELRTMAMRTGQFAGFDETEFGEVVEKQIGDGVFRFPEWARCTVHRMLAGQRVRFVGPTVVWEETFARDPADGCSPNAFWRRRARGQLEKCAEASALRRAFPEELGSEYAAEEIEGRVFGARPRREEVAKREEVADAIRRRLEARPPGPSRGFSTINLHQAFSSAGGVAHAEGLRSRDTTADTVSLSALSQLPNGDPSDTVRGARQDSPPAGDAPIDGLTPRRRGFRAARKSESDGSLPSESVNGA